MFIDVSEVISYLSRSKTGCDEDVLAVASFEALLKARPQTAERLRTGGGGFLKRKCPRILVAEGKEKDEEVLQLVVDVRDTLFATHLAANLSRIVGRLLDMAPQFLFDLSVPLWNCVVFHLRFPPPLNFVLPLSAAHSKEFN